MNQRLSILTKHLPSAASVAVGIVPLIILIFWFDVSRKIIGKGAFAYAVGAVGIKLPLYHLLVVKVLHKNLSNRWLAVSQGFISALSELGATLYFFIYIVPELTFTELIGFGIVAGSVEAFILPFMKNPLQGTPLESHAGETNYKSSGNLRIQWLGVVERVLASLIHTTTRGLLYISFSTGNLIPGTLAVVAFSSIDGRAYYAHLQKWQFDNIQVLGKFYRFLGMVAFVMILFFLSFYYYLM
ncbi:MAG: hypothetical protein HW421_2150 [Ignavibacteria bacterium]|nr:hypothetical protein [Ignavibacteria bacterium]